MVRDMERSKPRSARARVGSISLSLLFLAACRAAPPIVVASDLDNAPFAFVDGSETPGGRDVEMMHELADELGRPVEWRRMPFDALIDAVVRGDVDVVCATLGVTPERAERMLFTEPYFATAIAVVARSGPREPKSIADLDGRPVAGGGGTTSERAVRLRLPRSIGVFEAKADATTAQRLLSGEVDAAVMDLPAAEKMVAASGGTLRVLAPRLDAEDYALALPPDAFELRDALNRALARLRERGTLAELDRRFELAPSRSWPGDL